MGDLVALKTEDHRFDRFAIRMQPPFASHPRFRDDVCAAKVQGGKSILPSIAGLGLLSKSAQSSSGLREFRSTSRPYSVMVLRELFRTLRLALAHPDRGPCLTACHVSICDQSSGYRIFR